MTAPIADRWPSRVRPYPNGHTRQTEARSDWLDRSATAGAARDLHLRPSHPVGDPILMSFTVQTLPGSATQVEIFTAP